jgi:hypothetical protein
VHSTYINAVLMREFSHDPNFCVYEHDSNGSYKIGRSSFKYIVKYLFVDGKNYKTTPGLRELLTKSNSDRNVVIF